MPRCTLTELEIVEGLRNPEHSNTVFQCLYDDDVLWNDFRRFVGRSKFIRWKPKWIWVTKIPQDTIKSVYGQALLLFRANIVREGFVFRDGVHWRAYFKGISKGIWIEYNRKEQQNSRLQTLDDNVAPQFHTDDTDPFEVNANIRKQLEKLFRPMGDGWQLCLTIFLRKCAKIADEAVARELGIPSAGALRQRRRVCRDHFNKANPGYRLPGDQDEDPDDDPEPS